MKRAKGRQKKNWTIDQGSPATAAERAGRGPKMSVEADFLVLKWTKEQSTEAMDSAEMTLADVFKTHLLPRLEATKTMTIRYRGQITQTYRHPDWNARLQALKLTFQLFGAYPDEVQPDRSVRRLNNSKITAEGDFLTLCWSIGEGAEGARAMEAAGLTLGELLTKYVVPRLEATKTIFLTHRGVITERVDLQNLEEQLEINILLSRLWECKTTFLAG